MNSLTNRREFLKQAGTLGACACAFSVPGLLFSSCAASKNIAGMMETTDLVSVPVTAFAEKTYLIVQTKKFAEPLYVSKEPDGSFIAVRMLCTHKGCALNAATDKLVCPCHNSEFSLTGDVLKGPAKVPLQKFMVTTEQQKVMVHF